MKKHLLLVDDDLHLRNLVSNYLMSQDFTVCSVDNFDSALIEIRAQRPDLIIADIMMPNIDGYDFIRLLRLDNDLFNIPVIFLTAKGMTNDRIKGYDLGCNAYLTKPFDPDELVSIINNLLKNIDLLKIKPTVSRIPNIQSVIFNLTRREATILQLVVKGYRNKEIAIHLNVSIRNVEKYVSRLLSKTGTRNRTELAQLTISTGIQFTEGE